MYWNSIGGAKAAPRSSEITPQNEAAVWQEWRHLCFRWSVVIWSDLALELRCSCAFKSRFIHSRFTPQGANYIIMKKELQSAVSFVSDLLSKKVSVNTATIFRQTLLRLLVSHYQDHWFPEKPYRGSAYRCIRINHKMDPLLAKAGIACGFTETQLFNLLPNEFTMWVDPREVSYRIGEEGSIGLIYESDATTEPETPVARVNLASQNSSSPNTQNNNSPVRSQAPVDQLQIQAQQQQQLLVQHNQLQSNTDFFRTCKDQLRYILPESSEAMNFEYLSTYVTSWCAYWDSICCRPIWISRTGGLTSGLVALLVSWFDWHIYSRNITGIEMLCSWNQVLEHFTVYRPFLWYGPSVHLFYTSSSIFFGLIVESCIELAILCYRQRHNCDIWCIKLIILTLKKMWIIFGTLIKSMTGVWGPE